MNPDTGRLHPEDEVESLKRQGLKTDEWPRFAVGEQVVLKGYQFEVAGFDLEKHTVTLRSWKVAMRDKMSELASKTDKAPG